MPTAASVYVPVGTLTSFMIDALVKMGGPAGRRAHRRRDPAGRGSLRCEVARHRPCSLNELHTELNLGNHDLGF